VDVAGRIKRLMPSQWNVFAITLEVVGGTQQEKQSYIAL
jgi:hypothetical protein